MFGLFLVKREDGHFLIRMGCIYSKSAGSGPLRPPKAWKMDFSQYDKTLNENDLDDLREVTPHSFE